MRIVARPRAQPEAVRARARGGVRRGRFYARADELVEAMKDHPTMQVDNTCWEFMDANTHASLAWIDTGLSLERLTIQTGDLSLYCDLNMIVGPRAVDATRVDVGSQLHEVACDTGLGGGSPS